jgi:hypothetical protein
VLTVLRRGVDEATPDGESLGCVELPVSVLESPDGAEQLRRELENLLRAPRRG